MDYIIRVSNNEKRLVRLIYSEEVDIYLKYNPLCEILGRFYRNDVKFELINKWIPENELPNSLKVKIKPSIDLEKVIDILGEDEVKRLNYNEFLILKAVLDVFKLSTHKQVIKKIKESGYKKGSFITNKQSKELFLKIYSELKIKKTAKGTSIKEYFDSTEVVIVEDRAIRGFVLGYEISKESN